MTVTDADRELADALPGEVVTRALVRDVALPGGAGTLALITLDNGMDHRRPSTFGPRGLASLGEALDLVQQRAAAGEIVAVGVTGKPFVFAVGADLGMIGAGGSREQALAVGRLGHAQFRRLGELGVPSFAYVNGAALGGGLELALHCTYRTVSTAVTTIALPECFIGIVPGWGGSYLLPTLIGARAALDVIVANALNLNTMLTGRQAFDLGIADVPLEAADFLEESLAWTAAVVRGDVLVDRRDVDRSVHAWDAATAAARALANAKVGGVAPAPYRAIDLVAAARTAHRDDAFAAEDEALADLATGPEARASLYAFDLVSKRARTPAGAPDPALARPVTSIGIVGAGLMAGQLALLFVRRLKVPVHLVDLDPGRVEAAIGRIRAELERTHRAGRLHADELNRLAALVGGSTDLAGLAGCDAVIEAVFEDLDVKKEVFGQLEAVVTEECVLMTNTSALSIDAMAEGLTHPERVVGFHVFNPVAVLPLVEVARGTRTDDATAATALALAKDLKKTAVLVRDTPAFVVNRLLTCVLAQVMAALDEGTDPAVADASLAPLGLPLPPFALLRLVGPPIALHVEETLAAAYPERFAVSPTLRRMVDAGQPGVWSVRPDGRPVSDPDGGPVLDPRMRDVLPDGPDPGGGTPPTGEQVGDRALRALAREIGIMLDDGAVRAPQDIDLCLLLGAGWPFHLGGVVPYLDRTGISESVTGRRFLS